MVFSGLSTVWRLASWPTRRSPVLVNATTEGVKRLPSLLMITVGFPPSITATTEFVVPRSMPTAFAIPHLTMCILRIAHCVTWHASRLWRGARLSRSSVCHLTITAPYTLHTEQMPCQSYMSLISFGFLAGITRQSVRHRCLQHCCNVTCNSLLILMTVWDSYGTAV